MILTDDEIILQIRKGNEEALKLLFSCYEIHFKTLEAKMRLKYKFINYDREDFVLIMMENMMNIIRCYNIEKSMFFMFWKLLETRNLLSLYKREYNGLKIFLNQLSIDNPSVSYIANKKHSYDYEEEYMLKESYNSQLSFVDDKFGEESRKVLLMWSQGYKYDEISKQLNMKRVRINYIIRTSLKVLKDKKMD